MKQRVRMKEIATEAGVSVATVSRALQNHSSIPEHTRLRIHRIARRLGYRPNPMLGALMTQIRSRRPGAEANLACLHGAPPSSELSQAQSKFLEGVRSAAKRLGYHMDFYDWAKVQNSPEGLAHVWQARNVQGIILKNFRPTAQVPFPWRDFAWVVSGHNEGIPQLHRVGNEIYQIVKLAVQQALRRGYRRPGLALPLSGPHRAGFRWPAAFLGNLMSGPAKLSLRSVFQGEWTRSAFESWYKERRPDVVLSLVDQPWRWLEEMKVKIPEETGFIHLAANISSKKVSGVVQDFFQGGEAAVHALDSELRRNERGIPELPTTFTVAGKWRDGETLRPRLPEA